jgi:hypothetical protein
MSKSNYGIKIWLSVAKARPSSSGSRLLKFKNVRLGFLLVELMMAVFIGLVLISSLMRMQSILLELQDSFYMRGTALGLAVDWLECVDLDKKNDESGVCVNKGRDFRLNLVPNSLAQDSLGQDSNKSKLITKVKVEWRSLVGKDCCLEI